MTGRRMFVFWVVWQYAMLWVTALVFFGRPPTMAAHVVMTVIVLALSLAAAVCVRRGARKANA